VGSDTGIEWTDATWNPLRGCSRVSEGCRNCYAERVAARFCKPGEAYHGVAKVTAPRDDLDRVGGRRNGWTGEVKLIEEHLTDPLRWRRPRRIFVNSMSDLFHEKVSDEWIDRIFAVMALARQHTFQVLTKRPERMRAYLSSRRVEERTARASALLVPNEQLSAKRVSPDLQQEAMAGWAKWPLPNVWLGVSVEDQATADKRIPLLLQTPAAVRFVSYEPALGPVDFDQPRCQFHDRDEVGVDEATGEEFCNDCACDGSGGELSHGWWLDPLNDGIAWVIVGGESGPGARPFDVAWARATVAQCRAAGVACFVKQFGAVPVDAGGSHRRLSRVSRSLRGTVDGVLCDDGAAACADSAATRVWGRLPLHDRKGGDMAEWPEDLRVREFPAVQP
jgi:protein gp37